jgi:hypothetical protein
MDQQPPYPPQPPPPPQPPQRSWWSRNWKWALPVGCLLPIVLCGGGFLVFFFLIYGAVTGSIKSSDAYAEGMARARANPEVVAALGEPIESGFLISGSINVNGSSGNVDVSIPISGPKGSGTLYVVGTRTAGRWQYSRMEAEVPGRASRIDLRPRASGLAAPVALIDKAGGRISPPRSP